MLTESPISAKTAHERRLALVQKVRSAFDRCNFPEREKDGFIRLLELRNATSELLSVLEQEHASHDDQLERCQKAIRFEL